MTPQPTDRGLAALVADLVAAGAAAKSGSPFLAEPIGGFGQALCIGAETIQTYEFVDHEAALTASAKIDRTDPSKVGTGIVDWTGAPRFWLRDNVIVLYLGADQPTDLILRSVLGRPFAEGRQGRLPLPAPPCS